MSRTLGRPDFGDDIVSLRKRLGILERRLTPSAAAADRDIIFSFAGALTASESPPVRVRRGGTLATLAVTINPAGSTATILDVLRNGAVVATVTVPASTEIHNAHVGAWFATDSDQLSLEVTTAGTGAANMTAEARFT